MSARIQSERDEAIRKLREAFQPGSTAFTILRHVSRSGMHRRISVVQVTGDDSRQFDGLIARAGIANVNRKGGKEGVIMDGAGQDMGFALVYEMSYTLYPSGFGCVGEGCPSNDHSNGDRDYTPHGSVGGCRIGSDPCTCHDPSAWKQYGDVVPYPRGCSECGCHRVEHWHRDGGYALRHRWL